MIAVRIGSPIKFFLYFVCLFISKEVSAGLYPVITDIQTWKFLGYANYTIKQELREIPDALSEQIVPRKTIVGLAHRHTPLIGNGNANFEWGRVTCTAVQGCSIGELAREAYKKQGGKTTVKHLGLFAVNECIAYVGASRNGASWDNSLAPAGCTVAPPGDDWCNITTPSIIIDHGILNRAEKYHRASSNFNVECTAPMRIKINFSQDTVELGAGVTSRLTVENKRAIGGEFDVNEGTNEFIISSNLTLLGNTEPGDYSGISIATVEYF